MAEEKRKQRVEVAESDTGRKTTRSVGDYDCVSRDASNAQYEANPDPNPEELRPAPGPSVIQTVGQPNDDEGPDYGQERVEPGPGAPEPDETEDINESARSARSSSRSGSKKSEEGSSS